MALAAPRDLHPATAYAVDAVDGRLVIGEEVLWACRRHLRDLEKGEKRAGLWFDEVAADRALRFFGELRFVEGELAGRPFVLDPWQEFIVGSIFGWMRADGFRRYREAWVRVAKGNGKSPLAAGIGLYCTGFDGAWNGPGGAWQKEQRAQAFAVATKLKQAGIVHKVALLMAQQLSPALRGQFIIPNTKTDRAVQVRIRHPASESFFEPLGRESKTEDGWNPHLAIFDEVHQYGSRAMWDLFVAALPKRRQSLIFAITTAGYGGPGSFAVLQDEYYRQVLDSKSGVKNDAVFAYIAQLAPEVRCAPCRGTGKTEEGEGCGKCGGRGATGDDWRDEAVWPKANPNLGKSVYVEGLRDLVERAKQDKRRVPDVKVKNMNLWVQGGVRAIDLAAWDATGVRNPIPADAELRRRPCFAGLDLASNRDLNSLELYWPACGPWSVAVCASYFWVAEETVEERRREGRDYQDWIDAGEIETTPGEFVLQEAIRKRLNDLARVYTIVKVGIDRKFGEKIGPELQQDGFEVIRVAQTFTNLCPAWQLLERIVGRQELAHGDHRVLRWNAGNVVLCRSIEGLEMPSKEKSAEKIDGVAALLNAIHLAMTTPYAGPPAPPKGYPLSKQRGGGRREIMGVFGS
jgi:phage terminase large subunit-like protein